MLYLLGSVLAGVGIFITFKAFPRFGVNSFHAITINYWICVATGLVFLGSPAEVLDIGLHTPWLPHAAVMGVIFIFGFYLISQTTQKINITVATIANKTSLVIPVVFSLWVFKIRSTPMDIWNYLGMAMAVPAVIFSSIRKEKNTEFKTSLGSFLLPILVFIAGGLVDTSLNYVNYKFLKPDDSAIFTIILFGFSALWGTLLWLFSFKRVHLASLVGGIVLGVINFFSIYFILLALSAVGNNGAIVYPLVSTSIIILSSLAAFLIFREHLLKVNRLGLILAILTILLLTHQQLFNGGRLLL